MEKNLQERATALYSYLKELNALKSKTITNVDDYEWTLYLSELESDPKNIELFSRDRVEEESADDNPVLVKIHKPDFSPCPMPPIELQPWFKAGWMYFHNDVEILDVSGHLGFDEMFDSDPSRVEAFKKWNRQREEWRSKQYDIEKTRNLFMALYQKYVESNRDIDSMEIVVANGFLLDSENARIKHPLLTRRVSLSFNAFENTISFCDLDVDTELYTVLLRECSDLESSEIPKIYEQLKINDYHPLDRNDTLDFLKLSINLLTSDGAFSAEGIPANWNYNSRFLLCNKPVFIYRKRIDGTEKFLQNVIENIQETGIVTSPIADTVMGGETQAAEEDHEKTLEERLAEVGGEDTDILLSKAANKEQLEIAQRIERYNGVLVQGPPGTGKTHTIANLMGHFLAQGKSVLVTSHTPKALTVLKEKLPESIQPLCVKVLEDKNEDMEKSVDGISSFMSNNTANEMLKRCESVKIDRDEIIKELAEKRKKIYTIINAECSNIVFNGVAVSPSSAASFVMENEKTLSYIPGKVKTGELLPLTYPELIELYRSNADIDVADENEINCDLPSVDTVIKPSAFAINADEYDKSVQDIKEILTQYPEWHWGKAVDGNIDAGIGFNHFNIKLPDLNILNDLLAYVSSFGEMEEWMKYAAIDGQRGGAYLARWEKLISEIDNASSCREKYIEACFGKVLGCNNENSVVEYEDSFKKLADIFERKGKVSKLDLLFDKGISFALSLVTIDGKQLSSKEECDTVLSFINFRKSLIQCERYWNELIGKHNSIKFFELDANEPDMVAIQWKDSIKRSLTLFTTIFDEINERLSVIGLKTNDVFVAKKEDNAIQVTEKVLHSMSKIVPKIVKLCIDQKHICEYEESVKHTIDQLKHGERTRSLVCRKLIDAILERNKEQYEKGYEVLSDLYEKKHLLEGRIAYLNKIALVAPDWAEAIRSRSGIHGLMTVPESIEDAWKWKQYSNIISDMAGTKYDTLQEDCRRLGEEYRKITGEYASDLAWYHLLAKTETNLDMRQALNGWKLTMRKIGKGTGKMVPKYRAQAKKLMATCQNAVPAWIMPISRVVNTLDPRTNSFDIVIVDEASQSDISSLGVLYLGKKVIIVGDDKQVSPMAIGVDLKRTDALETMFIKNVIPNSHLYGPTTSLYDIAATTYQPLMLREHFRCVPDIIGFSNGLSYDYKIKPLRDSGSSNLLPAVVNYRVLGQRNRLKQNEIEAKAIVALIKACLAEPEYKDKTFGVISLLGSEQSKLIQSLIFENIDISDIDKHQILCGEAPNFQGDERDVIFISLVDSPDDEGPLRNTSNAAEGATKKRYNVAASRARDQLWVVDSLDPATDLKQDDLRKRLIEYSMNPSAFEEEHKKIESKAESPFEISVADALVLRGYKIEQEVPAGGYRLDIVVTNGKQHIAIECDGERFHSGEQKIREDMERQTILERSGWHFIRIRGSEYYRNPEKAMERVFNQLERFEIKPELERNITEQGSTALLERVKATAIKLIDNIRLF